MDEEIKNLKNQNYDELFINKKIEILKNISKNMIKDIKNKKNIRNEKNKHNIKLVKKNINSPFINKYPKQIQYEFNFYNLMKQIKKHNKNLKHSSHPKSININTQVKINQIYNIKNKENNKEKIKYNGHKIKEENKSISNPTKPKYIHAQPAIVSKSVFQDIIRLLNYFKQELDDVVNGRIYSDVYYTHVDLKQDLYLIMKIMYGMNSITRKKKDGYMSTHVRKRMIPPSYMNRGGRGL